MCYNSSYSSLPVCLSVSVELGERRRRIGLTDTLYTKEALKINSCVSGTDTGLEVLISLPTVTMSRHPNSQRNNINTVALLWDTGESKQEEGTEDKRVVSSTKEQGGSFLIRLTARLK